MTPDLVFVKDLESRALLRNPAALLGKTWDEIEGRKESEWHKNSQEAEAVVANDRQVIATGVSMQFVEPFTTPQGLRTLLSTKSPLFDESGKIVGIIGVSTDITEREDRAKQLEFVMRELTHRSKNLLTIIQSVARQSIRQSSNLEDFESKFIDRLSSLASLHDLLVQKEWQGASLRAIAETQVGPFAFGRIEIDGPEILLKPTIGTNYCDGFSRACHERRKIWRFVKQFWNCLDKVEYPRGTPRRRYSSSGKRLAVPSSQSQSVKGLGVLCFSEPHIKFQILRRHCSFCQAVSCGL